MRVLIFMLLGLCLIACSPQEQSKKSQKTESANFDWLLGQWQRTNDEAGKQTYEQWAKVNSLTYQGLGFTMQEGDTIWQEAILLIQNEGEWSFEVKGAEETTRFQLTEYDSLSFRCENPEHDFPTTIEYQLVGDEIKAVVSGGEMKIPFTFERRP